MLLQYLLGCANYSFGSSIRLWEVRASNVMLEVILLAKLEELIGGELWSIITHDFVWYSPLGKDFLNLLIRASLVVLDM